MPCNSNFGHNFELEKNNFELKLQIRNYFGLFLQTTTHFELKFELQ